jgi:hypothetical protein
MSTDLQGLIVDAIVHTADNNQVDSKHNSRATIPDIELNMLILDQNNLLIATLPKEKEAR